MKHLFALVLLICILLTAVSCTGNNPEDANGTGTSGEVTQTTGTTGSRGDDTSAPVSHESAEPMWTPNY